MGFILSELLTRKLVRMMACALGLLTVFGGLTITQGGAAYWDSSRLVDEASFRVAAELVGSGDLYNVDRYETLQRQEQGATEGYRIFLRPPWYAVACLWLSDASPETGLILWRVSMVIAGLLFVWAWPKHTYAALAICWSVPFASGLQQGQDDCIILGFLGLTLWFVRRQNDFLAGVALAVCSIKPNLFVFIPVAILAARRIKIGAGLATGLGCLAAISFLAEGVAWPGAFLKVLLQPHLYNEYPHGVSLAYLVQESGDLIKGVVAVALAGGGTILSYRITRVRGFVAGICAALAVAVITSPHAYLHDSLIVMPFALLALHGSSCGSAAVWMKATALFTLCPLWVGVYSAATHFATIARFASLVIALPLLGLLLVAAYREEEKTVVGAAGLEPATLSFEG